MYPHWIWKSVLGATRQWLLGLSLALADTRTLPPTYPPHNFQKCPELLLTDGLSTLWAEFMQAEISLSPHLSSPCANAKKKKKRMIFNYYFDTHQWSITSLGRCHSSCKMQKERRTWELESGNVTLKLRNTWWCSWKKHIPARWKVTLRAQQELGSTWASLGAQMVKSLPATWETWVWSLGGKVPWRREWRPTLVFLPGEPHGQKGPLYQAHLIVSLMTPQRTVTRMALANTEDSKRQIIATINSCWAR